MDSNDSPISSVMGTSPVLRSMHTGSCAALDKGDILRLGRLTRGRSDASSTMTPRSPFSSVKDISSSISVAEGNNISSHCDAPKSSSEFWDNSGPAALDDAQPTTYSFRSRLGKFAPLFVRTLSIRSLESDVNESSGNPTKTSGAGPLPLCHWFSRFRATLKYLLETKLFEYFIMLIIVANVICLAAMDPLDPESTTQRMKIIGHLNEAFTVVFVVEMCIRMISDGVVGKKCYFSSNWNCFDALITILSLADLIAADGSGLGSVKSLRVFRGLRALRLISSLKDLRFIVSLLVQCVPMLLNVMTLLLFVFLLFGIVGVQLFQGVLRYHCVDHVGVVVNNLRHCSMSDPQTCDLNQTCVLMDYNPNGGVQSFDTVPAAMMTLFQLLCLQDVGIVIERVQSGTSPYAVYYFLAFTLIGPVVVLNLFLAVIASSFEKSKNAFGLVSIVPNDTNASVTQASTVSTISSNDEQQLVPVITSNKTHEIDGEVSSASTTVINSHDTPSPGNEASTASASFHLKTLFAHLSNKIHPLSKSNFGDAHAVVPGNSPATKRGPAVYELTLRILSLITVTCRHIVDSQLFGNLMTFIIFLTVLTMAITKSDESEQYYFGLDMANVIYTIFFLLEMILKHIAYGIKHYWFDMLNAVDGGIVILSCVDAFSFLAQVDSVVGGGISVLRAFRLFRIVRAVKLVRYFPSLVQQIKVLQASLAAISSLCLLISLWIVIFAILGMNIFGGKLVDVETADAPRLNFDNFFNALLTVFVVFTTEGFPSIFANAVRGAGFAVAIPFFYVLLFVGTFILFNLFVAIIIEEFRSNKSDKTATKTAAPSPPKHNGKESLTELAVKFFAFQGKINSRRGHSMFYPNGVLRVLNREQTESFYENDIAVSALQRMGYSLVGKSMMVFSPLHPLRFWSNTFVLNRHFESVVTFFIMLSTLSLGLNGYELSPSFRGGLDIFDTILLVVFAAELLLKVIAYGFVIGEGAYLKSDWNKVDFVVVIAGMIDQIAGIFLPANNPALSYIRIIRVLRAFRPLRLISRYEGLRIVLRTIAKSIEPVISTVAILLAAFSIYGILGVQLFMEKFRSCNDSSVNLKSKCVGSYADLNGHLIPREWSSPPLNFDNLANALVCLFILSTQDDWTNFMWQGVDAVSPDEAPVENTNPALVLYFVSFIMIGNLLLLNVFVGVFADSYSAANINMLKDIASRKKFEAPLLETSPSDANDAAAQDARNQSSTLELDPNVKKQGPSSLGMFRLQHIGLQRRLSLEPQYEPGSPSMLRSYPSFISQFASLGGVKEISDPGTPDSPAAELDLSAGKPSSAASNVAQSKVSLSSWVSFVALAKELDASAGGFVRPIQSFIFKTSLDAGVVRLHMKWLTGQPYFDGFISVCIGLSIFSMTFDSFQSDEWQNGLMDYASTFFTAVFGLEVVFKVFAMHPRSYFTDSWNRFDYTVSIMALLAFPLEQFSDSFNPKVIRAVRLVRVLRSIRIFKFAEGMAQLIQSIVRSFPSVSNLFAIMFLETFVFAVLGVELFGDMCIYGDDPSSIRCKDIDASYFLSDRANFRNLGNACYVMYRLIISDNWSEIFQTMIVPIPNCQSSGQYNTCGIPQLAPYYFIIFVVITTLSLLNILVAIMIYFFDAPDDVNVNLTPGLTKDVFLAVLRRWKRNAFRIDARMKGSLK